MSAIYTAEATATGDGRNGRTRTADGGLDLDLAVPVEMGGKGGGNNPEQLFAAGYAACFHGALRLVAKRHKVAVDDSSVTAKVGIGPNGDGGYALSVTLAVHIPGLERSEAERLTQEADQVCPYSNAVRGNVEKELRVV